MAARGATLSARQQRAIDALIIHPDVEQAAGVAEVEPKELNRWLTKPYFNDALRTAQQAEFTQITRRLRQGLTAGAAIVFNIQQTSKSPARRLRAAKIMIRVAPDLCAMQHFAVELDKAEKAGAPANVPRGHGTKYPRKWHQAIQALIQCRSVSDAARSIGMARSTLCRWMAIPAFDAQYQAAVRTVLAPATRIVLRGYHNAITTLKNLSGDPETPEAVLLDTGIYRMRKGMACEKDDLGARLTAREPAGKSGADSDPAKISRTLGRNFYQRLARVKAALSPANWPGESGFEYVPAEDGRPAGAVSVPGPEGGPGPPGGSTAGETGPAQEPA
jgi:hypothetical protein